MNINWTKVPENIHKYWVQNSMVPGFAEQFHGHYSVQNPEFYTDAAAEEGQPPNKVAKVAADSSQDTQSSGSGRSIPQSQLPSTSVSQVTSTTGEPALDAEMGLPGTALGQGGAGDGNSNKTMPIYSAQKPSTIFGKKTSTYTKYHRFVTFALAHQWITVALTSPVETQKWLTTALAEIPWEYLWLYLTPAEYNLIPDGSYVESVHIEIVHRGVRIAFETATTGSLLATLNQIQNLQVAFGMNLTGWGVNRNYTLDAANPMVPSGVLVPNYVNYPSEMYSTSAANGANTIMDTFIPNHQIGQKMPLQNYWTFVSSAQQYGGVPCLQENIQMMDAKTTINQVIGSWSYKPKFGQLKTPLKSLRTGLPSLLDSNINIPANGLRSESNFINVSQTANDGTGSTNSIGDTMQNPTNDFISTTFGYYTPLEKSQFMKQGPWGLYQNPQVQPSIHIGIQAIPALTAASSFDPFTQFTDAQSDFEVKCTMVVVEHLPNAFPYATAANVPPGDVIYQTDTTLSADACTFAGLYPNKAIRLV